MMMFVLLVHVLLHKLRFLFLFSGIRFLSFEVGHCSLAGHAQPRQVTVVLHSLRHYIFP